MNQETPHSAIRAPSFAEAFRFWLKLGLISFGGPAGQIAIMQTELVERKRWISQARFLHALNFCMLLPGPEAQQLAIYIGWLLHRTAGGVVAGALFVVPSMFVLWALSLVYVTLGNAPLVAAIFYGLKPAVMAIVVYAVIRIGRKSLRNPILWGLAAAAFIAIFRFGVPFPLVVFAAGAVGFFGARTRAAKFFRVAPHGPQAASVLDDAESETPAHARPSLIRALRVGFVCGLLWIAPVLAAGLALGWDHTLVQEARFFSKAAVVTFGGAYAVLPYVAQQAVEHYHWLGAGQMLDGLGLAETTPGPLIMVLQFVGFLGGWTHPGGLPPLLAGTLGALITTWITFVPCFLWIFLGAPHIEQLRGNPRIAGALAAVTAAVTGVILNLAVWFGWHVLMPRAGQFDWLALAIGAVAFTGLRRWNWGVIPVVLGSGAVGLLARFVWP